MSYKERITVPFWQKIKSSADAADMLHQHWDKNTIGLHESFKIVLLNINNKVKGIYQISQGGITGTLVDLRIVFGVILKTLSVAVNLTHNHPSGTLKASEADKPTPIRLRAQKRLSVFLRLNFS